MRHEMLALWLLSACCLTLGHALNCSVTLDDGRASYSISGLPQVSAGDWDYTWANSTGHVIANNKEKIPGLVLKNTDTILNISEFIEGVVYTGIIVSEGERLTARCLINGTENAQSLKDKEFSHFPFLSAAIAAMAVFGFFILLVLLLVFLRSKFRDKIPSCSSRSPCGCIYTAVKNADPDVEAGSG